MKEKEKEKRKRGIYEHENYPYSLIQNF